MFDLIRWLGRMVFHYLAVQPRKERIPKLIRAETTLMNYSWLHTAEARAVTEGALLEVWELSDQEIDALTLANADFAAGIKSDGEMLMAQFDALVTRYCRPAVAKSKAGAVHAQRDVVR